MSRLCIIFDLDGTLVDSEGLCNQAFLDLLPEIGETLESMVERYRGTKLALILADLGARIGRPLPPNFEATYRARVSELFRTDLRPTPGTIEMLETLSYPKCVASSGPPTKIAEALLSSGLSKYFGDHVFSSYEVGSWKPDPGLFLHAARSMGYSPNQCIVVEDSPAGLQAAAAAGMTAIHYLPGSQYSEMFGQSHAVVGRMADLSRLIDAASQGV